MKKRVAYQADADQHQYWLLNNQDVNFVENDTSIITTASQFIHEKYTKLDVHLTGRIQEMRWMVDNGTKMLAFKVTVISGDLPKGTVIAAGGMHYGQNPLNRRLIKLYRRHAFQKGSRLDFQAAAITYRLWKGMPLNRNFLMYNIGINRSLPN